MKYKLTKQKVIALALTGTMIFSLAGCGSSNKKNIKTNDSKIISSADENGNDLRIIILYDSLSDVAIISELYGYLNEETLLFYDVINKKEYNFNDEEFKKFDIYYLTVGEFLSLRCKKGIFRKYEDAILDYAINKGISEEDLLDMEKSYIAKKESDNIYLSGFLKYEAHYIDEEEQKTKTEETTLAKSIN